MKRLIIMALLLIGCSHVPPQVNEVMLEVQQDRTIYRHIDIGHADYRSALPDSLERPVNDIPTMRQASCVDRAAWYVQRYLKACDDLGITRPDEIGYIDEDNHRQVLIRYGDNVTKIEPSTGLDVPTIWWLE